jgi:hypothetical protein
MADFDTKDLIEVTRIDKLALYRWREADITF